MLRGSLRRLLSHGGGDIMLSEDTATEPGVAVLGGHEAMSARTTYFLRIIKRDLIYSRWANDGPSCWYAFEKTMSLGCDYLHACESKPPSSPFQGGLPLRGVGDRGTHKVAKAFEQHLCATRPCHGSRHREACRASLHAGRSKIDARAIPRPATDGYR